MSSHPHALTRRTLLRNGAAATAAATANIRAIITGLTAGRLRCELPG